jgi:Flp pilus assembly protein TadD
LQFRHHLAAWLAGAASAGLLACPQAVSAQALPVVSRPVVQAMPSESSKRLSAALARIARDPRDFASLIEAGDAAFAMGDPEAATGFYKRADSISAGNPRIKAGLARALVLQGKPLEAIPLFAEAEAGGAALDVTADRGLAYDLVGDQATAQRYYQAALARKDDDEVRRRLGVSMAISGNSSDADAMLLPLLRKQDKPAWRTQAFVLAISGKTKEAVDTVNAILPGALAQSVTPYLRYMPRLTRAQQAAAVNLGKFPRASEIGRDDPGIAAYTPTPAKVAAAGGGLLPRGKTSGKAQPRTLASAADAGPTPLTNSQRRARSKAARLARVATEKTARVAPPEPMPTIDRDGSGELPPVASTATTALRTFSTPTPTPAPLPARTAPTRTPPAPSQPVARTARLTLPAPAPAAPARTPVPSTPRPAAGASAGFDLARIDGSASPRVSELLSAAQPSPATPTPTTPAPAPAPAQQPPVSLGQAFADLGAPSRAAAPAAGAVDIRTIEPAKPAPVVAPEPAKPAVTAKLAAVDTAADKKKLADAAKAKKADPKKPEAKKPEPKKALPSHPSRIWVQIGVGRNEGAIAFDWRKFTRENAALFKGQKASTSEMGRTNRILVGPFQTQKAASAFVAQAKKAKFDDAFVWTSPAGQVVDPLAAK